MLRDLRIGIIRDGKYLVSGGVERLYPRIESYPRRSELTSDTAWIIGAEAQFSSP